MVEIIRSLIYFKKHYSHLIFYCWIFIPNLCIFESKIVGDSFPIHYEIAHQTSNIAKIAASRPSDFKTAKKNCEKINMRLFKPSTWNDVEQVQRKWIPYLKKTFKMEEIEIWSDIRCVMEEITFTPVAGWLFYQIFMSLVQNNGMFPYEFDSSKAVAFKFTDNFIYTNIVSQEARLSYFCIKRFSPPPPPPPKPKDIEGENKYVTQEPTEDPCNLSPSVVHSTATPSTNPCTIPSSMSPFTVTPSDEYHNQTDGMIFMTEYLRKCGDVDKIKPEDLFNKTRRTRASWMPKNSQHPSTSTRRMKQETDLILGMFNKLLDYDTAVWKKMKE
ncbi:hypothetical protein NPIL_227121, partial [Nephila pilipes]